MTKFTTNKKNKKEKEKQILQQTKFQDQMASQVNSTKNVERADTYPTQPLSENCRGY